MANKNSSRPHSDGKKEAALVNQPAPLLFFWLHPHAGLSEIKKNYFSTDYAVHFSSTKRKRTQKQTFPSPFLHLTYLQLTYLLFNTHPDILAGQKPMHYWQNPH